ncbi:phage tail assembly protein [Mycobacteroides salmoniphilum]|uniref:phage tail assembly protein n=1 Tax=Mycobacteroides salmoniphilum TaxID=404941 RepID=UPI000993D9EA|nr:phage tail assembly protein [Mycobacteroides salmoniphilum]
MSNTFSLDDIRDAAQRKFCPLKISLSDGSEVELRGFIRLDESEREIVKDSIEIIKPLLEGDSADDIPDEDKALIVEALIDVIAAIAGKGGDRLVEELGDEFPVLLHVFETWMVESRLGEAATSPTS